jgi:hypothetical protein
MLDFDNWVAGFPLCLSGVGPVCEAMLVFDNWLAGFPLCLRWAGDGKRRESAPPEV